MKIRKGTIQGFSGFWNSGTAILSIKDSKTGKVEAIHCDNGQTIRRLRSVFGKANGGHINQEVFWSMDDMGLLYGLAPVDGAPFELVRAYESEENIQ